MRKTRTFIVEDSPVILENLTSALEELAGVEVVGSASGEIEALAWFGAHRPECDAVIIDIFLSSGSGLGVLRGLVGNAPPPDRVVLTNYATDDMRRRCIDLGAEKIFDKSAQIEELVEWFSAKAAN